MAYDSLRGRIVLFGGSQLYVGHGGGPSSYQPGTYEWDGTNWTLVTGTGPALRDGNALAYDSLRGRTVLFGGSDATTSYADTWEWNGLAWVARTPPNGPVSRTRHAMAYDSVRGRVVLFGGNSGGSLGDTWEWDGGTWLQRSPLQKPAPRFSHSMCFDSARARVVLYGGVDSSTVYTDTWEWDGSNWTPRQTAVGPSLTDGCMAYDPVSGRCLLQGGFAYPVPFFPPPETWNYGPTSPASFAPFGSGCAGASGVPTLAAEPGSLPWVGDAFMARITNLGPSPTQHSPFVLLGDSSTAWGVFALPFDLSILGMTGCTAYTNSIVNYGLVNVGGAATWSVQIPNIATLAGTTLYTQAGVTAPGANPFGVALSNACELKIGAR